MGREQRNSGGLLETRPHNERYGGVEGEEIYKNLATFQDYLQKIVKEIRGARSSYYALFSESVPGTKVTQSTGLVTSASTQGFSLDKVIIPHRITGFEIYNYDQANGLLLSTPSSPDGGILGQPLYIAPNVYWTKDLSLAPASVFLIQTAAAASFPAFNFQFILNGF